MHTQKPHRGNGKWICATFATHRLPSRNIQFQLDTNTHTLDVKVNCIWSSNWNEWFGITGENGKLNVKWMRFVIVNVCARWPQSAPNNTIWNFCTFSVVSAHSDSLPLQNNERLRNGKFPFLQIVDDRMSHEIIFGHREMGQRRIIMTDSNSSANQVRNREINCVKPFWRFQAFSNGQI